jgi:hypothetical protein
VRRRIECGAHSVGFLVRNVWQTVILEGDDVAEASTGWILAVEEVVVQDDGAQFFEFTEMAGDFAAESVLAHGESL